LPANVVFSVALNVEFRQWNGIRLEIAAEAEAVNHSNLNKGLPSDKFSKTFRIEAVGAALRRQRGVSEASISLSFP
jgi:hypothetical protein